MVSFSHWKTGVLIVCTENKVILGIIQMERFIQVECFREMGNTLGGITLFPFVLKRQKFSVPFVWIASASVPPERKQNVYRYFVNVTTQSHSYLGCENNASTIDGKLLLKFPYKW